jgi:CRISPR-associated endoribonuclease Cas6
VLLSPLVVSAPVPTEIADPKVPADSVDPLAAGTEPTTSPRRQRRYLTRDDGIVITEARLRDNLLAKYRALFGVDLSDQEFRFLWATGSTTWPIPDRPTRLIRLSGPNESPIRVRGNLGAVTLAGTPELLQLAMHTGLGQHNASGMGFVLPESELHFLQA